MQLFIILHITVTNSTKIMASCSRTHEMLLAHVIYSKLKMKMIIFFVFCFYFLEIYIYKCVCSVQCAVCCDIFRWNRIHRQITTDYSVNNTNLFSSSTIDIEWRELLPVIEKPSMWCRIKMLTSNAHFHFNNHWSDHYLERKSYQLAFDNETLCTI